MMTNPWSGDLDKYLFYCCPECDNKSTSKDLFIGHAITHHPSAKNAICTDEEATIKNDDSDFEDFTKDIPFEDEIKDEPPDIKSEDCKELLTSDSNGNVKCYFCDLVLDHEDIEPHIAQCHGDNKPVVFLSVKDGVREKKERKAKEKRPRFDLDFEDELLCEEPFSSKSSLQNHKSKKHKDILGIGFKCDKCNYIAKDAKRLKDHESSKHNPKFRCDQCDFVAPLSHKVQGGRLYALNVHKIRKHGKHNMEGTECEVCHFNFMTNNGLLAHMQREHGITVNDDVTCDICGKNIAKKSLTTHQRNMHGISPTGFMCHKCNKLLKSKEEEISHESEFHGKDLHCDKCSRDFDTLTLFNDHLKTCLEEPQNFSCKKCNDSYVWNSAKTLQYHWAEVHKLHRPICEKCGKALTHKHELKLHMKSHNNSHLHQCHHCGKSFPLPIKLSVHLRKAHSEDTWCYNCKFCDKKFDKTSSLKDHINSQHEKTIKHQCQLCEFWTYRLKGLQAHVRVVHKKVRNIACDLCDQRFVATRDKLKHMAKHHAVGIEK